MRRRRWFEIHSWLGIFSGLLLFVICWSGTVAVVSHEIDWLLNPNWNIETGEQPATWGELEAALVAAYPELETLSLHAPLHPGFPFSAIIDTPQQRMLRVYLDPNSAQILEQTSFFNVQRFFRSLHMSFFDFGSGKLWGYWFVGSFSIFLLISTLTPLIFYRRWWRGFFHLKTNRGARALWSDVHKLTGVWSLVFSLLIAITGLWYLVELFGVDFGYPALAPTELESRASPALPLDQIVTQAQAHWPELEVSAVTPARGSYWGNVVHIEGQASARLVRDRANYLTIDPVTGDVVRQQNASTLPWPARWVDTADPLHFGDFGGFWVKAIWFVLGLILSSLCLTGAYLHVRRLNSVKAAHNRFRWRGTGAAVALTALVLGIAAWGGWLELVSYGPLAQGEQAAPDVPMATGIFICVWLVFTLAILAAWSWYVLEPGFTPAPEKRLGEESLYPAE